MIQIIKNAVRKSMRIVGIDAKRYRKNKYIWLRDYNINTIIDVGANIGQFAREVRQYLPTPHIYSFEPIPQVFQSLIKNTKCLERYTAFNFALGDKNACVPMHINDFTQASSLLESTRENIDAFPHTNSVHREVVQVRMLDDVFEELSVTANEILVKMDVQGYEDRVISGGREVLKKTKVVMCEVSFQKMYKEQKLFLEIQALLDGLGFAYMGNINVSCHKRTGIPLFADAFFIRKS